MAMKTLLVLFGLGVFSSALGNPQAKVPDNLKECYNGSNMMIKDNLLPMTMTTFIALVKKVEDSFQGTVSAKALSNALLRRFRFDGIERNPTVQPSDLVIPYSPIRNEFFLYSLLMGYIISPDNVQEIGNDTLTFVERCTLHQMLSLSFDTWARNEGDEVCSQLSKFSTWNRRAPRSVPDEDAVLTVSTKETELESDNTEPEKFLQNSQVIDYDQTLCPMENGVIFHNNGALCPGLVLAGVLTGLQPQDIQPNSILERRSQLPFRPKVMKGSAGHTTFRRPSMRGLPNPGPTGNNPSGPGYNPSGPGYNPGGRGYNPNPSTISNMWAATVSGLLSEVSLLQGPLGGTYSIGTDGGWNDTVIPKYYFLTQRIEDGFTSARIRSAIDGLIIAKNVPSWNTMSPSGDLSLSELLTMYYTNTGVFDRSMRACKRKDNFRVFTVDEITEQTFSMGTVLQNMLPSSVNVENEGIKMYSAEAARELMNYIQNMNEVPCPEVANSVDMSKPYSNPVADLHVVVDCNWDMIQLNRILTVLGSWMAWWDGTNVTLVNGKNGLPMFDTYSNVLGLLADMPKLCNSTAERGFDLRTALTTLSYTMDSRLNWEKQNNREGVTVPRIVLFVPSPSANVPDSDSWRITDRLQKYKVSNPDVKFLFLTTGSKDKYARYVDVPDMDVVVITTGDSNQLTASMGTLILRIAQIPRRIINPSCGSNWVQGASSSLVYNGYLDYNEIQYFKIQPNYYYKNSNGHITVQVMGTGGAVLNVCSSRNNPNPGNSSSGTSPSSNSNNSGYNCKQAVSGKDVQFWLSDSLCPNSYATSCNPFYMSISSPISQSSSPSNVASCSDMQCRLPSQLKFTITQDGFSCYSGACSINVALAAFLLPLIAQFLFQ